VTDPVLQAQLRAEGLEPSSWSNGPGDVYAAHEHDYDKVLVVAAGSIRFGLGDRDRAADRAVDLNLGDRLDLPAGTRHDAAVGPRGVICLEAHLPAGSLAATPVRRPAGRW
jgi:mannose-6-phosphate isomerase-like protein (cupin superfamily)